jgi:predicted aspartyl protease
VNTYALIDSGASTSVFRPEIAKALRVSPKKKDIFRLATASGENRHSRFPKILWVVRDTWPCR